MPRALRSRRSKLAVVLIVALAWRSNEAALQLPWNKAPEPSTCDPEAGGQDWPAAWQVSLPVALAAVVACVSMWEVVVMREGSGQTSSSTLSPLELLEPVSGIPSRDGVSFTGAAEILHNNMRTWSNNLPSETQQLLARSKTIVKPLDSSEKLDTSDRWDLNDRGAGPGRPNFCPNGSVVFFTFHTVSVLDTATFVEVPLFRVGNLESDVTLMWSTVSSTATEGKDFRKVDSTCHFPSGVDAISLKVDLIPSTAYSTEKFFILHAEVKEGHGVVGGLPFARVRILTTRGWPDSPDVGKTPDRVSLLSGFLRTCIEFRGQKFRYCILANLWIDFERVVLTTLLLNYALYDYVLTRADDPRSYARVPMVILVKFCLILVNRYADRMARTAAGNGGVTSLLQRHLVRKYLEMQEDMVPVSKLFHLFFETAPECMNHGYAPTFKIIQAISVLVLSILMALVVPALKGAHVSPRKLVHMGPFMFGIPIVFYIVLKIRRGRFDDLTKARAASHTRVCRLLQDICECRHWVRAFDSSYPSQHVGLIYDSTVVDELLKTMSASGAYQVDTQWIAMYSGEIMRLLAVLYGSYAVLDQAHPDSMTLGELAVLLSLHSAIISAVYSTIEACGSLIYASLLLREIAEFLNQPNPRLAHLTNGAAQEAAWREEHLSIRIQGRTGVSCVAKTPPTEEEEDDDIDWNIDAEVMLGCVYGIRCTTSCDGARRQVAAMIARPPGRSDRRVHVPSFARMLLLAPPSTLGAGPVLEVLLASAAGWVRARDAMAVATVLGLPFDAPDGAEANYGLDPAALVTVLASSAARAAQKRSQDSAGGLDRQVTPPSPPPSPPTTRKVKLQRLPTFTEVDTTYYDQVGVEFRARMRAVGVTIMSPTTEVVPLLRAPEAQLVDLARAILSDPDVLLVQDALAGLALSHGQAVLRVLGAWQRLGGLRGLVRAWEQAASSRSRGGGALATSLPSDVDPAFPTWLTASGGLIRTVVLSESSLVSAGLELDSHIDAWIEVSPDRLCLQPAGREKAKGSGSDLNSIPRGKSQPAIGKALSQVEEEDEEALADAA